MLIVTGYRDCIQKKYTTLILKCGIMCKLTYSDDGLISQN